MTTEPINAAAIADALCAEFLIQHLAGGHEVDRAYLSAFIARELARRDCVWAYRTNGGKTIRVTPDKQWAEQNADGFQWINPRVRRCAIVQVS